MKASFEPYLFFLSFIHTCIHDTNQIDALNEKTFHNNDHQTKSDLIIIYPKTRFKRSLRNAKTGSTHDLQIQFNHESEEFAIYLRKNEHLVTSGTVVEWHYPNGTKQLSKLTDIGSDGKENNKKQEFSHEVSSNPDDCLFIGEVIQGRNGKESEKGGFKSVAAIDVCDGGYRGYLQIGKDGYIIRPLKEHEIYLQPNGRKMSSDIGNGAKGRAYEEKTESDTPDVKRPPWLDNQDLHAHALEPVNSLLQGLDMKEDYEDIKDKKKNHAPLKSADDSEQNLHPNIELSLKRDKRSLSNNASTDKIDDILAQKSSLDLIPDWDGYYIGDVWSAQRSKNRQRMLNRQRNHVNSYAQRPFYQHVDNHGRVRTTIRGGGSGRGGNGNLNNRYDVNKPPGEIICNGPYCEYFRVKKDDPKWLETTLAVDGSVVSFHGPETVKRYVLTLLNIVSAIYGDPTLGANLKFVILRLIFYEETNSQSSSTQNGNNPGIHFNPVDPNGNSKQSLINVNEWNEKLLKSLPENQRHDIAIWLTRLNIGGPSGYAPVDGICDPARSCSLNRDEGLSSAFIIAHELGHILGMSHDGDMGYGNNCHEEATQGSVMAPMVGATFSYFHWSSCSAGEYHFKSNNWKCMNNYPHFSMTNATFIGEIIEYTYSLDDQCRMEFGQGFKFCRSFQLSDPCTHLWCSHVNRTDICKTKKGPPMDGTECGSNRWCVNGYCEPMSKRRTSKDGLRHNPRAGGWSAWGTWGDCSRSCGTGARFRTRQCDNPRPAYGGAPCIGEKEEFKFCNIENCDVRKDFRAEQCRHLFEVVSMDIISMDVAETENIVGGNMGNDGLYQNNTSLQERNRPYNGNSGSSQQRSAYAWFPYEHSDPEYKCKLNCFSRDTREYYQTGENVIDGTPCSYDNPSDVCVQGKCIKLGCDKIRDSPVEEDRCGVCGGDGSKCKVRSREFNKRINKVGNTKIMLIPKGARNIHIILKSEVVNITLKERETNQVIFKGKDVIKTDRTSVVAKGTRFKFIRSNSESFLGGGSSNSNGQSSNELSRDEVLIARGPLLGPIVVMGSSNDLHAEFKASITFTVAKTGTTEPSTSKHEWVIKGWSKCSKECGGGKQHLIVSCVDKTTGKRIRKKLCGPKSNRPVGRKRRCNTFPCDFHWVADKWEYCTTSCGLNGVQSRQIYCVPSKENITDQLWAHLVDPKKCKLDNLGNVQQKPVSVRECNRVPCPAEWKAVGWSACSRTCGNNGVQQKEYICEPHHPKEKFYDCGIKPFSKRSCEEKLPSCDNNDKNELHPCISPNSSGCECKDASPICGDDVMMRYCSIPSYSALCCKSCKTFTSNE